MARLVAGLHDDDGRITVDGFYDGVTPPTEAERELANAATGGCEADYVNETGVPAVGGETDFTPAERVGFRPSIDVNGIHAGYGGSGVKTIIPARAEAKITARLVPGQDPGKCLDAVVRHLQDHSPAGLSLEITEKGVGGPALRLNSDSRLTRTARDVLDRLTEMKTVMMWDGASIPIVAGLSSSSGAEPLLAGFGHAADRIHAPNESFSIEQFRLGFLYAGLMLQALGPEFHEHT
jgi:acetylornithine deacetylase/succinyl-diaminopimelate desuccinylase-like protein